MIERAGAGMLGLMTAAAVSGPQPVVWHFFGVPFEVPSMIAAIFGVVVTRVIAGHSDRSAPRVIRVATDALASGLTFFLVMEWRPDVLAAVGLGISIGAVAATIVKVAEKRGQRLLEAILPGSIEQIPPQRQTPHSDAIDNAMNKLHQVKGPGE